MQLKGIAVASVVDQIGCDRCGKEVHRTEPGFAQMLSIGFNAGRDSIFEFESRVEIDLCETCLRETLGTWLRVRTPWEIEKMPQGDRALTAGQPQAASGQDRSRFAHMYGVLSVEEMADRLKCSTGGVREREAAGEIFAAHEAAREGGRSIQPFSSTNASTKRCLSKSSRNTVGGVPQRL